MRTSRLSREAAQLNAALTPRTTRRTTRSTPLTPDTTTSSPYLKRKRSSSPLPKAEPIPRPTKAPKAQPKPTPRPTKALKTEPHAAPARWEEVYAVTQAMRADIVAPVDTMGCATLADPTASARDQRFQTLVALMLSSQTKDVVTAAAMGRLREEVPGGFNLESILALPAPRLNELIAKVGFHNVKTAYILRTAAILRDEHDSDIPATIVGLTSLPGVGPKMAYLCLSAAWGRDEGIGVDVHVHRITNRWGWNRTKGPEETRKALEGWLPRDKWNEINHLLVGFGQTICAPVRPRCGECGLAEKGLCPSAKVVKGKSSVVKKETITTNGDAGQAIKKEIKEETKLVDMEDIGLPSSRSSRRIP